MRVVLLLVCFTGIAFGQTAAPLPLKSGVQDKNFYLLSLIERTADVKKAVQAGVAGDKREKLVKAAETCALDLDCYAAAMKWTDTEIGAAEKSLRGLYRQNGAVKQMVDGPLRRSGVLVRFKSKSWEDLLAEGWAEAANGINRAIDVYGTGAPPRYPEIDSISFDVKMSEYRRLVQINAQILEEDLEEKEDSMTLFFEPSLRFALALMEANHRDEAGRLEPLELGENAAAVRRMKTVDWARCPYTAIVVPGSGTDRLTWSFSPYGEARVALAAKRFHDGKAPFILVSGGYVHPNQTPCHVKRWR